jgi:hypothetical protein
MACGAAAFCFCLFSLYHAIYCLHTAAHATIEQALGA